MQALAWSATLPVPGPDAGDAPLAELLARGLGRTSALATRSDALAGQLALHALDLDAGDEVVLAPGTRREVVAAVLDAGACPVYADVDARDGCLTVGSITAALTPRSRAVLVQHAHGAAAPVEDITALAHQYGVRVVEDATEAFLAELSRGGRAGSAGDLAFVGLARDSAGVVGGAVATADDRLARRLRALHDQHRAAPTALQALALRDRTRATTLHVAARRAAARHLTDALGALPGLTLPADLDRPTLAALPLLIDPAQVGVGNATYAAALAAAGVSVLTHALEQPLYRVPRRLRSRRVRPPVYGPGHCPVAEDRVGRTLVLLDWSPGGPPDVEATARAIRRVHDELRRQLADRTGG